MPFDGFTSNGQYWYHEHSDPGSNSYHYVPARCRDRPETPYLRPIDAMDTCAPTSPPSKTTPASPPAPTLRHPSTPTPHLHSHSRRASLVPAGQTLTQSQAQAQSPFGVVGGTGSPRGGVGLLPVDGAMGGGVGIGGGGGMGYAGGGGYGGGAFAGVGVPMRHPRPLTAADLAMQMERENEAVVNRLTRELTSLRAQTASVASNASMASSAGGGVFLDVSANDVGPTHPTASRRHRSSSSFSLRSLGGQSHGSFAFPPPPPVQMPHFAPIAGAGAIVRDGDLLVGGGGGMGGGLGRSSSFRGGVGATGSGTRPEEVAFWQREAENREKENLALRERIRELERLAREKKGGDASGAETEGNVAASVRGQEEKSDGTEAKKTDGEGVGDGANVGNGENGDGNGNGQNV